MILQLPLLSSWRIFISPGYIPGIQSMQCNGVYSFRLSVCVLNTLRWHAEHMNCNSCFPTFRVIALWILKMAISTTHMCPLYILKIVWDIFMKLHTDVNTIIGCAEHKNHNSGLHTLLIIAHTLVSTLYLKNRLRYFRKISNKCKAQ